ncbi:AAA family ATPase [Candidatus Woesearchaeota archaeon]|nr:AAA family ATPase [Candidatus Woesearchaeota archaeon]
MLLKSLYLENIRSYTSQKIEFPSGIVLLSGDIGSGKSTILLAIEFALFGILPGELSGGTLLRNGEDKGTVEIIFELNNQKIKIQRTLKKTKTSVTQGNGHIIKQGIKKDMTPVELKTAVFDLLGYPKEMLTKSKNIYRFTVYTPQEDMKRILMEKKEDRLDVLRKLFDIDKYKRIQDNTSLYVRQIKENQKEKAGITSDLEEKKKNRDARQKEFILAEKKLHELKPKVDAAKIKVQHKQKIITEIEKRQKTLTELKQKIAVIESEITSKKEQHKTNLSQAKELEKETTKLREELSGTEIKKSFIEEIDSLNKKIQKISKETQAILEKKTIRETDKKRSEELKKKIAELNNCPTCLQIVDKNHKEQIAFKEDEKIQELILHIDKHLKEISEKETIKKELENKIEELRKKEKQTAELRIKQNTLENKEKQIDNITQTQEKLLKTIDAAETEKEKIQTETKKYKDLEKELQEHKKELNFLQETEKKEEIEFNRAAEKKENIKSIIQELDMEINKKEKIHSELMKLNDIKNWLSDYFIKLTETIEKQVMLRVYHEFNELFQTWFDALIADETISCRLDDTFTPVIIQNGYDVDVVNLSGGEKTACALAYRLALNKVINDLITGINTKELLILDEPTDGFSSEQLDQMRDVLEQLNMKQIIIVSHETKVETFADQIIKVQKNEHISEIQQ